MAKGKKIAGFEVNSIGIGTAYVGRRDEEDVDALRYSIKKGQNHIDTAELYENGKAEDVVGEAIKDYDRKKLFIATKVWRHHATSDGILTAVEGSLERLATDYVDLLYIHACWDESEIDEYMNGLNRAQDKGLTKSVGVSNFDLKQLQKAVAVTKNPIVALQNHFNINHQYEVNGDMKYFCKKENITIVAYSPLEDASTNKTASKIAEKYEKTPEQIALNWLIKQENVVTIPKSTNKKHIDENLETLKFELEKEDFETLFD
jgi:diketogulonate reductase-like aldo/keto reductase